MTFYFMLIMSFIGLCFCCEDVSKVSFLAPFNDLETIQSIPDEDIILVCCHPDGADDLRWEDKDGKPITFKNTGGIFSLKDEKNRLILRIDNLDNKKVGSYNCRNRKREISKSILIFLKEKPLTPTITKLEKILPKSKIIKIECPLKDRQTFKSWKYTEGNQNFVKSKPGKWKNYEISENSLNFTIKMNGDSEIIKMLWCEYQEVNINGLLFNGLYEISFIFYDPINVVITMENKGPILESHDVKLTCTYNYFGAQNVNFPQNIFKPSFIINTQVGKIDLTIPKITKDLENEYLCKVTNFLSYQPFRIAEETAKIKIEVVVPPKIIKNNFLETPVKLNEDAYLKCDIILRQYDEVFFEKFIPADSSWLKLNTSEGRFSSQIHPKDGKITLLLFISSVQWSDRGKYRCSATNAAGKDNVIGDFKVEKSPQLYTKTDVIDLAMKPVQIDCSISGFPVYDLRDLVELRILNETSNIAIRLQDTQYDVMDGLKLLYEVSLLKKIMEEETYLLECLYNNASKLQRQSRIIELRIVNSPDPPNVEIICSGSTGIVFKYEKPIVTKSSKNVTKNQLFFARSTEFESLLAKPSKIIPLDNDNESKNVIYVLQGLLPDTNYSLKWESFNTFQISNFRNLSAKTKSFSPPNNPTSMKFSPKQNMISVTVMWNDDCPYAGANGAIGDILINMKPDNNIGSEKLAQNWNWVESNISVDVMKRNLQFFITMEKPRIDYKIEVKLRSKQGISEPISEVYRADVVLAGSLCFPRCLSKSLLSSLTVIKLALVAFVIFVRMI